MAMSQSEVVGFVVENDAVVGGDGFLQVRRTRLRNRRDDGTTSDLFSCDFLQRPVGIDAVVVALFHRAANKPVQVLLRQGLRPALALGRPAKELPIPDERSYCYFTEVVAGVIEREDQGEAGIRRRAAIEAMEEAGYRVEPSDVQFLGAGTFPSPGSMPEKFWLTAVEIHKPHEREQARGDGSAMEELARHWWVDLDAAIRSCVEGDIEDAKTEIILRRLKERLGSRSDPR